MNHLTSLAGALLLTAAATSGAQAQIINGGFESGLTGWTTFGDASAVAGGAPVGNAQLVLTTANLGGPDEDTLGPFNVSGTAAIIVGEPGGLETQSGFALGAFDPLPDVAVEGSLARQSFSAAAGSALSFRWNFGTREAGSQVLPDYAFVAIDGVVIRLASVANAMLPGTGADLLQTGYSTFGHTFASGGTHTLAFGVVDVDDSAVRSALYVDAVTVSAVPEPQTWALLVSGLAFVVGVNAIRGRGR